MVRAAGARRNEKAAKRLEWAHDQIEKRGGLLLITARFIPGGRTVLTLSSGDHPAALALVRGVGSPSAALIWATYAAGLGYVFGQQFEDNHTLAFMLAFGAALSITLVVEVVRHLREGQAATRRQPAERLLTRRVRADRDPVAPTLT